MLNPKIKDLIFWVLVIAIIGGAALARMNKNSEQDSSKLVAIHIKGEIRNPGYYELKYGSRVKDAIEKGGGATEQADVNKLNLAQKLRDGEEIIIPAKDEKDESVIEEKTGTEAEGEEKEIIVNINTAKIDELCTLDGIGEETALKIIDYRSKNGGFSAVDELKNIGGIGDSKFEKIRNRIKV